MNARSETRESVRARLARRGLAAHRARGQNFLVDRGVADRIADAAGIEPAETVLEIGTGLGLLTEALAARAARVITVEIDAGLVAALREEGLPARVELRHADALDLDWEGIAREAADGLRVVANLPYSISSPLLRRLLDARGALRGWTVMVQREVAARLLAATGSRDYGSLTVLHRLVVRVERLFDVSPRCFHPVPRVVSTVVGIAPRPDAADLGVSELAAIERVVRAAFGQRRKTLWNALRGGLDPPPSEVRLRRALAELEIDPRARAETVAPECWRGLTGALARGDESS